MTTMRNVCFSMSLSVDGYINGPDGTFDWAAPDEELHQFHNDRVAGQTTQLLGRRLYERMLSSPTRTKGAGPASLPARSLADEIPALKAQPGGPIADGGATLAAECAQ